MGALIEADTPATWRDFERRVGQILEECGLEVEIGKPLPLAKGGVNVDVYAIEHTSPPNVLVVECKHWKKAVPQAVVHGFRSVVGDSGANTGLIVSAAGFQAGAVEAAAYTNIRLVDWEGFQAMFTTRWYLGAHGASSTRRGRRSSRLRRAHQLSDRKEGERTIERAA